MPKPAPIAQRAAHSPPASLWLAVVVLLTLALSASQLGAPPYAVLAFSALQIAVLGWWVLAPQRDGSWVLLTAAIAAVATLGLLVLPWATERERPMGPPALVGAEPVDSSAATSGEDE